MSSDLPWRYTEHLERVYWQERFVDDEYYNRLNPYSVDVNCYGKRSDFNGNLVIEWGASHTWQWGMVDSSSTIDKSLVSLDALITLNAYVCREENQ